ncbi:hypothetical protein PQX77_011407 [Marasmius sp. AFHP31]|nr:hypothetical protein PM082_000157 [Marasmius tenuissimus]KAK1225650.1 hypothetical protein PQX77_011407 [Marasmius sp. AFHP31]
MAFSSEVERQRYSQQLAEYTLRQFSAARVTMDKDELAAAKLPPAQRNKISRWVYTSAGNGPKRTESSIRTPIAA